MEIEVLVVPDCSNEALATERLRLALDEVGLNGTEFTTRTVTGQAEAERVGFTGSPTVLIGGRDPFAQSGQAPGLSCRIRRTADGLAGVPDVGRLRAAMQAAADSRWP